MPDGPSTLPYWAPTVACARMPRCHVKRAAPRFLGPGQRPSPKPATRTCSRTTWWPRAGRSRSRWRQEPARMSSRCRRNQRRRRRDGPVVWIIRDSCSLATTPTNRYDAVSSCPGNLSRVDGNAKEANTQRLEAFLAGPLEWTPFDDDDARATGPNSKPLGRQSERTTCCSPDRHGAVAPRSLRRTSVNSGASRV